MPITITGPLEDSRGGLVTGEVKFLPYPFRGGKGTAKTAESASKLIAGSVITQQFTDGEPDFTDSESWETLDLYAGVYQVKHAGTILYRINVPDGDATRPISELVSDDVEGPPSVSLVPDPASSVEAETSFGGTSQVGTSEDYARADHKHGTPAVPSAAQVGADPAGTAALVAADLLSHASDTGNPHEVTAAQVGADPAGTASTAVSNHAAGTGVHSIAGVTGLQTALDGKAVPAIQVTSLPASPTRGQLYELTQADDTAMAAPGFYIYDGTGWFCLAYSYRYLFPFYLGGSVSLSLIPGLAYFGSVQENISSFAVSFSRTGIVGIILENTASFTVASPTMPGRAALLLSDGAWDAAAGMYVEIVLEDQGDVLISSATELQY